VARTTVDIDDPLLRELKAIQKAERRSLGKIISQLLAEALGRRRKEFPQPRFQWIARPMRAKVDLADKQAVYAVLDRQEP